MPETFLDKRRKHLSQFIEVYGGTEAEVEKYLEMWVRGRVRQQDIEMIMAKDFGATSDEIAALYGYNNGGGAQVAINEAVKKIRSAGLEV